MTKSNTKAFTLIELLIVIVIIGILAVALIPKLVGSQASARDAARQAGVQQTVTAVNMAVAEGVDVASLAALAPDYLQSVPAEVGGSQDLTVTVATTGTGYIVCNDNIEREAKGNATACPTDVSAAALTTGTAYFVAVRTN